MIHVIQDPKLIGRLQNTFLRNLKLSLNTSIKCNIGHRGDTLTSVVHYSPEYDFWILSNPLDTRYWNGFGLGKPHTGSLEAISAEINFPFEGINRSIGGIFGKDESGNIYVLHRGKIGGGKKGIGKRLFEEKFTGKIIKVIDDNITTNVALIAELESPFFVAQIHHYIKEVQRIKNSVHDQKTFKGVMSSHTFNDEFFGTKSYKRSGIVKSLCNHGIVVKALADKLKELKYTIANNRFIDIYTVKLNGDIHSLFEIKTIVDPSSLYSAIGQLIIYSINQSDINLFIVLPEKINDAIKKKLFSIGIEIIYYKWQDAKPIFIDLRKKLNGM